MMSSKNFENFCSVSHVVLSRVIEWFVANMLVLNVDEIYNE